MQISPLTLELAHICEEQFSRIGYTKPDGYFLTCLEEQSRGLFRCLVAHESDQYAGHIKLVWASHHPYFIRESIPEIQDLNVLPNQRGRGLGTSLIRQCERIARERSPVVGIGVGLHPGYNNAQRLYSKLGYILDGQGMHYKDKPVERGKSYPVDDELILYFTKTITPK